MPISRKQVMAVIAIICTIMAIVFMNTTSATAAESTQDSCVTNTAEGATPGDDACTLHANAYTQLTMNMVVPDDPNSPYGSDMILANDGLENASCMNVTTVGSDPADKDKFVVDFNRYQDTGGASYCSIGIWINPDTTGPVQFTYGLDNGDTHTVSVEVIPYVPPTPPTVTKMHRKGYIKVCNRGNDFALRFLYGSFKLSLPDGRKTIKRDSCLAVRVHRHKIDWLAFNRRTGEYAGEGHVRNIRLPKGDGPQVLDYTSGGSGKRTALKAARLHSLADQWSFFSH